MREYTRMMSETKIRRAFKGMTCSFTWMKL